SSIAFIGEPWPTKRTGMRSIIAIGCAKVTDASSPRLPPRVFLLSPARAGGERMSLLLSPRAGFALAWEFQRSGAPLGELFQFGSGLYFRGKLAYARAFARPPRGAF